MAVEFLMNTMLDRLEWYTLSDHIPDNMLFCLGIPLWGMNTPKPSGTCPGNLSKSSCLLCSSFSHLLALLAHTTRLWLIMSAISSWEGCLPPFLFVISSSSSVQMVPHPSSESSELCAGGIPSVGSKRIGRLGRRLPGG